ncbi:hypothetical protein BH24CHL4_BH24CHL4_07080 [soil metagenome]
MSELATLDDILTLQRAFPSPLTIGVLADTHIWRNGARTLPWEVPRLLSRLKVDLILHAGDISDKSVLAALRPVAPVIAVYGNNDGPELRSQLALRETIDTGGHRIGLVHGHGGRTARQVAFEAFPDPCELVVYGHSHIPKIEQHHDTVFFNPGSPTDRRWSPHFGVGLIRCDEEGLNPELILFSKASDLDSVSPDSGDPNSN